MASFRIILALALTSITNVYADYTIDPNSVPLTTRSTWCQSQTSTCPLLCLQQPGASLTAAANTCDPQSLTYSCICGSGISPNSSQYTQTLPFYICQTWGEQCVANCSTDNTCASACTQNHPCGAQNPVRVTSTSSSSSLMASSTQAASTSVPTVYSGPSGSTSSSTTSDGQSMLQLGQDYGLGILMLALLSSLMVGL